MRRVPVPAIAALLLIAGVLAFGVIRVLQPDSLPGIDEDSVGLIELDSGRIVAQYAVGQGPAAVVAGGGAVWVANQLDGTVSRIDRAGEQVVTIDVGGEPTGLAYGSGSLWVADGEGRAVAQVDPRSNRVVQRIVVGNAAHAVAVGYGAVWVASAVDATVVRIDLRSGRAGAPIPVQARPSAIAAGAGSIWVASDASARVLRLDPRSGTPLTGIHVGNGPAALSVGAGAVWVANRTDGTVTRIDPASEVTESVGVGPDPQAVAAGPGGVWVAVSGRRRVVRLDPRSNDVTTAIGVGSSPAALALDEGTLWTAGQAPASAHRGGTLRVSHSGGQHLDPHSFDPLATLVYDGLVSYRRAGGVAGGTLVPDLTRELPDPAPDGRSYTFRLRPGIRFSDGRPLRVDDVRASIERFLVVTAGMGGASGYLPIRGAAGCTPAHCDLSQGIEIDAETASVTIHLSARDPEFLHKLSNALVVPAGTPRRLATTRLPAGTGPYRAQSWDPKRGGVLVRNPRFRVWTPDRPDGFPDRIVVGFQPLRAALAAVDRGETDVASLDLTVPGDGLATRYGARLHADPIAQLFYVFLNVDTPPFDDVRVRRAVNYAADRGRVARLLGSAALQQPTCQMLPPGFEGYTPSCPFTVNPSSAGVWTAPDLERARRLVAESGTRGMRVEFWTSPPFEPVGRYFASLLRRLGYRSRVRTLDDLHLILDDASASRPQLGIWAWVADSTGPFNFLKPLVSCGGDVNLSRFCDPRIDVAMRRAAGTGGPDAIERWRRVEEQLAAQAPTVPLTNAKHAVVTGERVGNYQQTALQGPLLDQLWVR